MEYQINKGERATILQLIASLRGVNRTDGRVVARLEELLRLDEVASVPMTESLDNETFNLSDLEAKWLVDHLNVSFEKTQMPPRLATFALSLEEKLRIAK